MVIQYTHLMTRWMQLNGWSFKRLAAAADCSEWHLRNIFSGRKQPSLPLAKKLSELSGGVVPMDAFLRPVAAERELT